VRNTDRITQLKTEFSLEIFCARSILKFAVYEVKKKEQKFQSPVGITDYISSTTFIKLSWIRGQFFTHKNRHFEDMLHTLYKHA